MSVFCLPRFVVPIDCVLSSPASATSALIPFPSTPQGCTGQLRGVKGSSSTSSRKKCVVRGCPSTLGPATAIHCSQCTQLTCMKCVQCVCGCPSVWMFVCVSRLSRCLAACLSLFICDVLVCLCVWCRHRYPTDHGCIGKEEPALPSPYLCAPPVSPSSPPCLGCGPVQGYSAASIGITAFYCCPLDTQPSPGWEDDIARLLYACFCV